MRNPRPLIQYQLFAMTTVLALSVLTAPALAQSESDGTYQIMKATEDRVWRLNKDTGEIAVCTLSGENLFCTSTSEAVEAPKLTYEEWEVKKKEESQSLKQQEADRKERDMAFLERMLDLARSFIQAVVSRDEGQ